VRVTSTPELRDYVEDHGGVLYVTTHRSRCCASVAWVTAATTPVEPSVHYEPTVVDGMLVCVRFPTDRAPAELNLALEGKRRKRPIASWDGCAFVV
jgi:hypothetical protein